jgi:hypothetical protein
LGANEKIVHRVSLLLMTIMTLLAARGAEEVR